MQRKFRASRIGAAALVAAVAFGTGSASAAEPRDLPVTPASLPVASFVPGTLRPAPSGLRLEAPQLAPDALAQDPPSAAPSGAAPSSTAPPAAGTQAAANGARVEVTDVPVPSKRPAWQVTLERIARRGLPFLRLDGERSDGNQLLLGVNRDGYLGVYTAADDGRTPEPLFR